MMKDRMGKLFSLLSYLVAFICACFVPRRADRWVFGSFVGVGEGPLAVARELRDTDETARITWIAADAADAARAETEGFASALRGSWASFCATITARQIVISHGYRDVNRFGIAGATIIHLGHGVPLKQLHHHIGALTEGPGFVKAVLRRVYRVGAERVALYVAASVPVAERLRQANRVAPGRVRPLGDPRDDAVCAQARSPRLAAAARAELRRLLDLPAESNGTPESLVLYAPTWRDGEPDPAVPTEAEAVAIRARLAEWGARLVIRSHPMGSGAYDDAFGGASGDPRVHALPSTVAPDITPLLGGFDAIITDYSSIAIDYALLARPIVWFAPDLAHYAATRGLYEPLEMTAAGRVHDSWETTFERLGEVLRPGVAAQSAARDSRSRRSFPCLPRGRGCGSSACRSQTTRASSSSTCERGGLF